VALYFASQQLVGENPDLVPKWPAEINRDSVEALAELAVEDGLLTEPADLDALLP
jgi:NitT/TauT family transport system substrate-binding protein